MSVWSGVVIGKKPPPGPAVAINSPSSRHDLLSAPFSTQLSRTSSGVTGSPMTTPSPVFPPDWSGEQQPTNKKSPNIHVSQSQPAFVLEEDVRYAEREDRGGRIAVKPSGGVKPGSSPGEGGNYEDVHFSVESDEEDGGIGTNSGSSGNSNISAEALKNEQCSKCSKNLTVKIPSRLTGKPPRAPHSAVVAPARARGGQGQSKVTTHLPAHHLTTITGDTACQGQGYAEVSRKVIVTIAPGQIAGVIRGNHGVVDRKHMDIMVTRIIMVTETIMVTGTIMVTRTTMVTGITMVTKNNMVTGNTLVTIGMIGVMNINVR